MLELPSRTSPDELPIEKTIDEIVKVNTGLRDFWSESRGWAPIEAVQLLSKSRLDWQVSLSESLRIWTAAPDEKNAASTQILGYANLGALVEGTMKLFLSVYYDTYKSDADAIKKSKGKIVAPDGVTLEPLRHFFTKRVWAKTKKDDWDPWIQRIQSRRNAIHAYKDREVGTHVDLCGDIRKYLTFVRRIASQLPYPDDQYGPDDHFLAWETDAPTL